VRDVIVVATQVVEVGLDISATDIAYRACPANSLVCNVLGAAPALRNNRGGTCDHLSLASLNEEATSLDPARPPITLTFANLYLMP